MTGYPVFLRIIRGFFVWSKFIWNMNLFLFLVPVVALILICDRSRGILAIVIGLQMLYSIYVGGDAWESLGGSNRYISVVMPQFFILLAHGISLIKNGIAGAEEKVRIIHEKAYGFILKYHIIFLVFLVLIQLNNNYHAFSLSGLLMMHSPLYVEPNKKMVERALAIKNITTPDARIAVTWAGAFPYFSDRYTVDILGKTDRKIAREKMRTVSGLKKFTYFYPGHLKYDYRYSIGKLKPDAVLQYWGEPQEYEPYLLNKYSRMQLGDIVFILRNDSKNILWDKIVKETQ